MLVIHGDIAFERIGRYKSVVTNAVLGVNLVFDKFWYVASDILPQYHILKQSNNWLWRYYGDVTFKDLGGYKSVANECSLGDNLVIDIFMKLQILHICIKFGSNRTITYIDIDTIYNKLKSVQTLLRITHLAHMKS